MKKNIGLILAIYLMANVAYCADVASQVDAVTNMIPSTGIAVSIIAMLVEMFMRFKPTAKPASLFYTVAAVIKAMGSLFTKVGMLLDSVLQNVKVTDQEKPSEQKSA